MTAKDISIPTTLCLSILLEHNATKTHGVSTELKEVAITGDGFILEQPPTSADNITGEFLDQPSTNGIISEDRLALLDLVGKREAELEELQGQLENLQQEYKKDLASMGERITMALMEKFSFHLPTHGADGALGKEVSGVEPQPQLREDHALGPSIVQGNVSGQLPASEEVSGVEPLPQHREGANTDIGFIDIDDTAGFTYGMDVTIASETCLLVNPVSSHFNCDVHEVLYSNQFKMKRYCFKNSNACMLKRREQLLSDLMNDECMNPNAEEVAMLRWLKPNALFPIALNPLSGSSDALVSDDSYELNAYACVGHNQDNKLHDSENSNACFAEQVLLISD